MSAIANKVSTLFGLTKPVQTKQAQLQGVPAKETLFGIPEIPTSSVEKNQAKNHFDEKGKAYAAITPQSFQGSARPIEIDTAYRLFDQRDPVLFTSGFLGRHLTARLVGPGTRTNGDFRFVYGRKTFEAFQAADNLMRGIPRGSLADSLTMELVSSVNKAVASPDSKGVRELTGDAFEMEDFADVKNVAEDTVATAMWLVANLRRGNAPRPGTMREDLIVTRSYGPFTDAQVEHMKELGCDFRESQSSKPDARTGRIVYVPADQTKAQLQQLIDETVEALKKPAPDYVTIGSQFSRRFAAIHPFEEWNGRTGRMIMDRIIAEGGMPPPIMVNAGEDISESKEAYSKHAAEGVLRSANVLIRTANRGEINSPIGYAKSLLGNRGQTGALAKLGVKPTTLELGGGSYALGQNGFLFDSVGRAYEVNRHEELRPLSQLEMMLVTRRLATSSDPLAAFDAYTKPTRDFVRRAQATPSLGANLPVPSDDAAIEADNKFRLELPKRGNARLIGLYDFRAVPAEHLFAPADERSKPSPSRTISLYNQIDLEMWHVASALKRSGDREGLAALMQHREGLFEKAQKFLFSQRSEDHVTASNPYGFQTAFEQISFDRSPLRYESLARSIRKNGDDVLMAWRGDAVSASLLGVQVDNIPFRPDAEAIAALRQDKDGTSNLIEDLSSVGGASKGSAFQCYTTDLALLAKHQSFASKSNNFHVPLKSLPGPLRWALDQTLQEGQSLEVDSVHDLLGMVDSRFRLKPTELLVEGLDRAELERILADRPRGVSDEARAEILARYDAVSGPKNLFQRVISDLNPSDGRIDVGDLLSEQTIETLHWGIAKNRSYLLLRRDGDDLSVKVFRRAYLVGVPKDSGMPGIWTVGGRFEFEQEVTGTRNLPAAALREQFSVLELLKPLPLNEFGEERAKRRAEQPPVAETSSAEFLGAFTPGDPIIDAGSLPLITSALFNAASVDALPGPSSTQDIAIGAAPLSALPVELADATGQSTYVINGVTWPINAQPTKKPTSSFEADSL